MPRRGSILLVDDEEKILKTLGRALRDAGHEVVETTSPREAGRLLGERPIDVFIVDNVMPELGGLDLIRQYVASTPEGERAQILMMTAHATVESAIEAMKLGALDYLQKPSNRRTAGRRPTRTGDEVAGRRRRRDAHVGQDVAASGHAAVASVISMRSTEVHR